MTIHLSAWLKRYPQIYMLFGKHRAKCYARRCPSLRGPDEGGRRRTPPVPPCAPQVKLLDFGSPLASKANVVAYDRHVLFAADDPTGTTRHRAPGLISTTRVEEAIVHEMTEQLVG